jgi:hypothetical protein
MKAGQRPTESTRDQSVGTAWLEQRSAMLLVGVLLAGSGVAIWLAGFPVFGGTAAACGAALASEPTPTRDSIRPLLSAFVPMLVGHTLFVLDQALLGVVLVWTGVAMALFHLHSAYTGYGPQSTTANA